MYNNNNIKTIVTKLGDPAINARGAETEHSITVEATTVAIPESTEAKAELLTPPQGRNIVPEMVPEMDKVEARSDAVHSDTKPDDDDDDDDFHKRSREELLKELQDYFQFRRPALRVYASDLVLNQMSTEEILKFIFQLPRKDAESIIPGNVLTKLKQSRIFQHLPGSEYINKENPYVKALGRYLQTRRRTLTRYLPEDLLDHMSTEDILKFLFQLPEKDSAKIIPTQVLIKLKQKPELSHLLDSNVRNDPKGEVVLIRQTKTYPGKNRNTIVNIGSTNKGSNLVVTREVSQSKKAIPTLYKQTLTKMLMDPKNTQLDPR